MTSGSPPEIPESSPLGLLLSEAEELIGQRRFAEALDPMRAAAEIHPNNARIQTVLGGLYIELRKPLDALDHLHRAIELNPRVALPFLRLGIALQLLGENESATDAFEQAVNIRPDLTEAQMRLALLYSQHGRRQEATQAYKLAARSVSEVGDRKFIEAQACISEGRESEAEALLRAALQAQPDLPTAHGLLGRLLWEAGRFDDAAKHLEAQIDRSPLAGLCYYDYVRTRKISQADQSLMRRMESALADPRLDDANRAVLLLAQGKALDDLGRYEEAIKSLDAASELRGRASDVSIEKFEKQVDDIIQLFGPEVFATGRSGSTDRTPMLILGMPRSGTTLVEQIASSHPAVEGGGELAFWRRRLRAVLNEGSGALTAQFLETAAADYLKGLRAISETAKRVTDKDPFNFLAIGLIHLVFPDAAIVHCRRNPLDVAVSIHQTHFTKTTGLPTGGEDLVRYFRAYERLMAHWRRVLPAGRIFELEYERVTASPQSEIRSLIAHIGLEWDNACLAPHVNNMSLVRTPSGWQVRQSINTDSVGRWRRYEPWLGPLAALQSASPT